MTMQSYMAGGAARLCGYFDEWAIEWRYDGRRLHLVKYRAATTIQLATLTQSRKNRWKESRDALRNHQPE